MRDQPGLSRPPGLSHRAGRPTGTPCSTTTRAPGPGDFPLYNFHIRQETCRKHLTVHRTAVAPYNVHEDELWMHHKRRKHASEVRSPSSSHPASLRQGPTHHLPRPRQSVQRIRLNRPGNGVKGIRSTSSSPPPTRLLDESPECPLTAAHYFVIKNSDPEAHRDVGQRMHEYLARRRRNKADAKLVKVQNSMPTL